MWRTIAYYFRVLYNCARLPIWSLLNGLRIRFSPIQKLSTKAKLSVGKKGKIILGNQCMIEEGTHIRSGEGILSLGDKVFINRNCTIVCNSGISIGSRTTIGPNVCIYDHDHDMKNWNQFIGKPIKIGEKVWIGANVTILKGVTIGDHAVIGAGAVVIHDVSENHVVIAKHETIVRRIEG